MSYLQQKPQFKALILELFIIGVFFQGFKAQVTNCDGNTAKPLLLYNDKSLYECVDLSGCKLSTTTIALWATENKCSRSESDCPRFQQNKPGYKRSKQTGVQYTQCTLCPTDQPVASSDYKTCGLCDSNQVFSYKSGLCSPLETASIDSTGYFSLDMKIFYISTIQCPTGQIYEDYPEKQTKRCKLCPLESILADFSKKQCNPCPEGKIADESTRLCLSAKTDCKNKLSYDGKYCLFKCPYGEITGEQVGTYSQCKKCQDPTPFSSSDQTKCLTKCSEQNEFTYEKIKNSCIKKEQCDGFILDSNNICLQNSCEVLTTTQQSFAIKLMPKEAGKSYQVCKTCPSDTPFLSYSFQNDKASNCMNCTSENLIQDYITGKCSKMQDLKNGFLDKGGNIYLPNSQKCPTGQYLISTKIPKTTLIIKQCIQCPSSLPISSEDGLSCGRTCPDDKIADESTHTCVDISTFSCEGFFLSSDSKSCASGCPNGEIKDPSKKGHCIKCPPLKPFRNQDETQCLSKCPNQSIFHKKQQKCIEIQNCQEGLFVQVDGKSCDELCQENQIMSKGKDKDLTYNVCVDCTNKYRLDKDEYIYCGETCPDGYYGDPKTLICHPNSECNQFITGSIPICSDACSSDEYIYDKNANEKFAYCNKNCKDFKFKNSDGINTCTKSCLDYVDSNKTCVKQCSNDEYLNPKSNPQQSYIQCTKTCNNFYQYDDGKQKCVDSCDEVQSSDTQKKICSKTCKNGEIAIDQGTQSPLQDYLCVVSDKCPQDYTLFTHNNVKKCAKVCPLYLSVNKKDCLEKCEDGQFAQEKSNDKFIKYECSKTCESEKFKYKDENGIMKCSNICRSYLQSNGQTCGSSCQLGEYVNEKKPGDTYFKCSTNCKQFEIFDEKTTMKYCVSECPLYLSTDKKSCIKSCPAYQIVMDKQPGQKYFQCVLKCEGFSYTDKDGVKRCSKNCPYYIQSDKKTCDKQCQKGEYINDKTRDTPYFTCSATCDGFEYHIDQQIRCSKRCPEEYVEQYIPQKQKICIKKNECKGFISSDGKQCIEKCNQNNKEFIKSFKDFKVCFICKKYYIIENDVASCQDECPNDQVGVPQELKCFSQKDAVKECDSYKLKLSSDKKKCTEQCQYPEVTNSKGQCKKPCSKQDLSCKKCEDNELSQTDGSVENCISKDDCRDYISSDGKRCIANCSIVSELQQENSKVCVKCKEDEVPIFGDKVTCQKKSIPKILNQKLESTQNFVKQQMDSKDKVEEVKKQIEDLQKDAFEQVKQKNLLEKDFIKKLVNLSQEFVNQITLSDLSSSQYTIGSKDGIITNIQKKKEGYKFKKQFSLDNVQSGSGDLLEENSDDSNEDINLLSTSAIAQNPSCTTESCKQYPLFQVDFQTTSKRILEQNQQKQFSVTFNVDKPDQIKKYICLSYNLDDSTQKPNKMQTTPSSDNKSITCVVEQNVSILFDSSCDYVDKSNCPTNEIINPVEIKEESEDDSLSIGVIVGIAVGSVVFVGVSVFLGVCLYKRHKSNKKEIKFIQTIKSPECGSPADRSPVEKSQSDKFLEADQIEL